MKAALLPFAAFVALAALLAMGLRLDPREVPSPLVGKPVPVFQAASLLQPERLISPQQLRGQVWVLNVWSSWCAACRQEHATLLNWVRDEGVTIYGLNYKDRRDEAIKWLRELGDPYAASLHDPQGLVGLDFGVYGVPETFVIDRGGVIRLKHVGAVTEQVLRDKIMPVLRGLDV